MEKEVKESKEKDLKETKPLYKMTVKELKEVAMEIPHDHESVAVSDMKKDELLIFIKEARGIKEEEPEKEKEKKKKKKFGERQILSKKEIRKKIIQLREEKRAAQEIRDRKKTDLLRRHISRLKKQTRKIAQT